MATTLIHTGRVDDPEVAWLALRPDHTVPGTDAAGTVPGVACLALGIGRHGSRWLDQLARSPWFAGLEPSARDLAAAGSVPAFSIPGARPSCLTGLPGAPMATVAVGRLASDAERDAAVGLVGALRQRRSDGRTRMAVLATVEHGVDVATRLAAAGAFVIEGTAAVPAQHLHHFPLRAAVPPRAGRVVCADLADHLVTWPASHRGRLYSVPARADAAERHLRRAVEAGTVPAGAKLANLHWLRQEWPPGTLAELDDLATRMTKLFDDGPKGWVYTDAEPMDEAGRR